MDFLTELFIDGVADAVDAVANHLINKKLDEHSARKDKEEKEEEIKEEIKCQSKA